MIGGGPVDAETLVVLGAVGAVGAVGMVVGMAVAVMPGSLVVCRLALAVGELAEVGALCLGAPLGVSLEVVAASDASGYLGKVDAF